MAFSQFIDRIEMCIIVREHWWIFVSYILDAIIFLSHQERMWTKQSFFQKEALHKNPNLLYIFSQKQPSYFFDPTIEVAHNGPFVTLYPHSPSDCTSTSKRQSLIWLTMVFITTQGQICLNKHTNNPRVPLAKRPLLWDHKHQQLLLHYEFRQIWVLEQREEADEENVKAIGFMSIYV